MIPSYHNKQRDLIFSLCYLNKIQHKGSKKNKELANNSNQTAIIEPQKKKTSKTPKRKESLFHFLTFDQKTGAVAAGSVKP